MPKFEEPKEKHLTEEFDKVKFEGFFVSYLGPLMLYLHGWLLQVYPSCWPLHLNKNTKDTHSFLHYEDKVRVWPLVLISPNFSLDCFY